MYVAASAIRPLLRIRAEARIPTRFGEFNMVVFNFGEHDAATGLSPDHVALVKGQLRGKHHVLCRVHSECLTSEVFGSLKCDCKEQLEHAQQEIARAGEGVILYLRQEGRGIGLANKIRAYELQSIGHDTVDANRLLELPDDARKYDAAAAMLEHLGVASVKLMTNNPEKVDALRSLGVTVEERRPSLIRPNAYSRPYLEAKRARMNHVLPDYEILEEVS
ncbi:MAG: GTP cyclohydrolase II [Polyangiaceae bacterium]|nr:GTP cyclohydrolase II [Polyangiaceae bacterium]